MMDLTTARITVKMRNRILRLIKITIQQSVPDARLKIQRNPFTAETADSLWV